MGASSLENKEFDLLVKLYHKANRILNEEEQLILQRLQKQGVIKSCTAVPSPALIGLLDKQVFFVLISANNSADFNRIKKKLKSDWRDKISSFTLIGESDFLCKVYGTEYVISLIRDEFDDFSQQISVCRVEDTLVSWGTIVPEHAKQVINRNLPERIKLITELQEDCRTDKISEKTKEKLLKDGLVIKYTILKDYKKTRILKGFVIVSLPVRRPNIERFERVLLSPEVSGVFKENISNKKLPVITGIYRLSGELGDYLLEVQFGNVYEYHTWMNGIYGKIKNLDSQTFLSDSCISELMDPVERIEYEPLKGKDFDYLGQSFRESLAQAFISLSESQKSKFSQLTEKKQRQIVSNYERLIDLFNQMDFKDRPLDREKIGIAINNLLQAMVEESKAQYLTIMGPVGTVLENYLNDFTLQEVSKEFSSFGDAQQSFGMPSDDFGHFNLNQILHLLRAWNSHKRFQGNPIVAPDTIIRLEKINDLRNYSSHGGLDAELTKKRPYAITWNKIHRFGEDLVDGFFDALYILIDLNTGILKPKFGVEKQLIHRIKHIEEITDKIYKYATEVEQPLLAKIANVADEIKSKIAEVPESSISDQAIIEFRDGISKTLEKLVRIEQINEEEKKDLKVLKESLDAMTKTDLKGKILRTVEIFASFTELTTGGPIIIKALAPHIYQGLSTILKLLEGLL